jgi:Arc/MetJ-type ribon-helix-helix transcriptional regulator
MESKPMTRTNFYLPEETRRKLKAQCALEGRDMSDVVRELINRWLREREAQQK